MLTDVAGEVQWL